MFNRNNERLEREIQRMRETIKDLERRVDVLEKREMKRQPNGVDYSQKW